MSQGKSLSEFVSGTFQTLVRQGEQLLTSGPFTDLTVREFRVIEAVISAGRSNTMGALSKALGITLGSLTVAVKTLERKGYLQRKKSSDDGRRVQVVATSTGLAAGGWLRHFQEQIVGAITGALSPEQLEALGQSLEVLTNLFAAPPTPGDRREG